MNKALTKFAILCGLWLAGAVGARSQPLEIHTLAGNLFEGATNGFGSNARFNNPNGVTVDVGGNVFVVDTGNGTIRKIAPNGLVSTLAGLAGNFGSANGSGSNARFHGPQSIAVDNLGNLYVSDAANSTIRLIAPNGSVSTFAGSAGVSNSYDGSSANARFYQPQGIAVDAIGNIYVADSWNATIRKMNPGGFVTTLAGLAGTTGAMDGTNSKARFHRPAGIACDSSFNLFVTDSMNHTVRKITSAGKVTTIAGMAGVWGSADGTNSGARFFQPQGIVVLNATNLLIVDSGNQTLRKVSAVGTNWVVTTVAGLTGSAGSTNGVGDDAQFYFASGIAKDSAGHIYVADSGNNEIRTTRVVPPTLQAVSTGNLLTLSWPVSSEGFILEMSPVLGPSAVWLPVTNGIVNSGDNFVIAGIPDSTSTFFRLHRP